MYDHCPPPALLQRIPGHDWCIIQLGLPGSIRGFEVDTSFFTGNFAPRMSIQGATLTREQLAEMDLPERTPDMGKEATEEEKMQVVRLLLLI